MKFLKNIIYVFSLLLNRVTKKNIIPFIYYHDIVLGKGSSYGKTNLDNFKKHIEYLKVNEYSTLSFCDAELKNIAKAKQKSVLITFDDGYISNYTIVFPLMKELGMKFNIFLEYGSIGEKENYLNWDMINEMKKSGIVSFGAHTFTHKDARFIDSSNYQKEILQVNQGIFDNTGIEIKDFCFPYGAYDRRIVSFLDKTSSYKRLYTSDGRPLKKMGNSILIGRVGIEDSDDTANFRKKIHGEYDYFYYIARQIKKIKRSSKNEFFRKY